MSLGSFCRHTADATRTAESCSSAFSDRLWHMGAMKSRRHAAALTLLVVAGCASSTGITGSTGEWLLMVPPLTSGGDADTSEPLSKWQNVGNFANQADCKNSMTTQQFAVHRYYGPIGNAQNSYEADAVRTLNAQCVSTKDLRFAK
jgi:hypothetical protein